MRLRVIGCSGSLPGPGSAASSYLLTVQVPHTATSELKLDRKSESKTWNVLLDLGNGALGELQRYLKLSELDAVVLSHLHADHCADMSGLYVAAKYSPDEDFSRIPVYAPQAAARRLPIAYDPDDPPQYDEAFDFVALQAGQTFTVGPLELTPFRVNHPIEAYAIRIEWVREDGSRAVLTYSGDTDSSPDLEAAAHSADVFLCEAGFREGRDQASGIHLTGKRAGEAAARAGAKWLVLTHIPPWTDATDSLAEARQGFAGQIAVAQPGDVYQV